MQMENVSRELSPMVIHVVMLKQPVCLPRPARLENVLLVKPSQMGQPAVMMLETSVERRTHAMLANALLTFSRIWANLVETRPLRIATLSLILATGLGTVSPLFWRQDRPAAMRSRLA
jgi:hypothetical protein